MSLDSPLTAVKGVGDKTAELFASMGINTLKDLLFTFPRAYLDYSQKVHLADLESEKKQTIIARVESFKTIYLKRGRIKTMQKAILADATAQVEAVWFNMPFLEDSLIVGQEYAFVAKLSRNRKTGKPQLNAPLHEKISDNMVNTARIVPVYRLTTGLSPKLYRRYLKGLLNNIDLYQNELNLIPEALLEKNNLPKLTKALQQVHFPETFSDLKLAKLTLGIWELIPIQLKLLQAAAKRKLALPATHNSPINQALLNPEKNRSQFLHSYWRNYPFEATPDQITACEVILDDFLKKPIYRLIQGDVGSGKTAVAGFAAALCLESGADVVMMVPTTVLANQHHATLSKIFGEKVQLVTAETDIGKTDSTVAELSVTEQIGTKKSVNAKGGRILIGTQALLHRYDKLALNLGMLIVDEEHRFGVKQREHIAKIAAGKTTQGKLTLPHYLSLTATPIPRTLALSIFGNIDLSVIKTKPKQQLPKQTFLVPEYKRQDSYKWIAKQIEAGTQVFWICPLIEEIKEIEQEPVLISKDEKVSVEKLAKELRLIYPDYKIAMLHGKLQPEVKQKTLTEFKAGKHQILVSTTVIEVGIDIPNANIIVIEGAQSFGLAQLHQLRGRVGRGSHQGYCLLFPSSENPEVDRLQFFAKENDGLKLAEYDLQSRGPGEVYGTVQSGIPNLEIADITDQKQLEISRQIASLKL